MCHDNHQHFFGEVQGTSLYFVLAWCVHQSWASACNGSKIYLGLFANLGTHPLLKYMFSKALQHKWGFLFWCNVSKSHIEKLTSAIFTCQGDCNLNWQNKLLFTHSHWLCYIPGALCLFFQLRAPLCHPHLTAAEALWMTGRRATWLSQLAVVNWETKSSWWDIGSHSHLTFLNRVLSLHNQLILKGQAHS